MGQTLETQDNQAREIEVLRARIVELEEKLKNQRTLNPEPETSQNSLPTNMAEDARVENERNAKKQLTELNLIYETAPVGLCFMDSHLRFVRINQTLATINGHSVEDHVGRTLEEVLPQLAPTLLPTYQRVLETKKPVLNLEVRGTTDREPKKERDWLISYVPVLEGETVLGITTVVQDITDRKLAEKALQEMNVALSHATPGISLLDNDGRYLQVNDVYASLLGYSPEELLGQSWKPTVHPDDYATAAAAFEVMRAIGKGEFEARAIRKDGSMFYKQVVMVRGIPKAGSHEGYHCFMCDITEQKQAEESLRSHEWRLNTAQRLAHIGSWELDLVNNVLTWSDEVFRIFEIEQAEFGASYEAFLDSIHPEDREFVDQKYTESVNKKLPYEVSHRLLMADGRIKFVHERCETVYDDTGIPLRSLGTIQDITDRKITEEVQGDLGRLLEESLNEIYIFDAQSLRFLFVNRGARENLGYSIEELHQLRPVDLKPEYTPESFANLLSPLHTKEKESLQFQTVHKRKDGTTYPVEVHLQVATWNSKPAFVAMILDITDRKASEVALRISENSIRKLYEITSSQNLSFEQKIRALLGFGCERLGLPHGTLTKKVGEHLELEFLHTSDKRWIERTVVSICESFCGLTLEREDPLVFEHAGQSFLRTSPAYKALGVEAYIGTRVMVGKTIYGSLCFFNQTARPLKFTSADQDFLKLMARWVGSELERQQAETALQENERRFRMVCEAIPQQVWTTLPDGTLDYVNERIREFFQQPCEQLVGQCWHNLIHPDDRPMCLERWEQSRQTNQPYEIEFRLKRKSDEAYRPHIARALPVFNQEGHVVKWFGTNTDITDLKEMDAHVRQAQKMEAIGTLAGGIAHDFNNVLGVMLGFAQLAQRKAIGNEALKGNLQEILVAGKRAKDLVDQILTFGRQEEGSQKPMDMNVHVRDVLTMVRATLPSTIDIHSNFSNEAVWILGDLTQLQQVMLNLCSNADHAMRDKGGPLEIGTEIQNFTHPTHFDHLILNPGRYVRLWVKDTGHGIPPNVMNRIFDPFFTTKGVGEGTGMGLAMVHGIVAAHHGAISVESQVGQGTTFSLYFPQIAPIKEWQSTPHSPEISLKKKARILFVDDEMALACIGKEMLEALGCEVDVFINGREALERFRMDPSQYDVVISDQTMPEITGYALAQQLLHLRGDLPIILCTGFSHSMNSENLEQSGIQAFLKKPVLKEDLIQTLNKIL